MQKEIRTICYDEELHLEAYRLEGIAQSFPNHFHNYYVIGFIEAGIRSLYCKNKEYTIKQGNILLFNPNDNHSCVQCDGRTLDYRGVNISKETMLSLVEEITGEKALIRRNDYDILLESLKVLTDCQKRRVVMHFFAKLSYKQIGDYEGCSYQAIQNSVEKSLKKIKKIFKKGVVILLLSEEVYERQNFPLLFFEN